MAPLLDDPNFAVLPDFMVNDHREARAQLIANGIVNNAQVAELLAVLWTMKNNTAWDLWAEQLEEAARDAEEIQCLAAEECYRKAQLSNSALDRVNPVSASWSTRTMED
ncbi:uncharacterized protein EDB91DRAFT_1087704 [Suillus paluster]|uniref:uncharacterized protein n=1 Tax=Suillus paluster TaxID=48578 RepID=UPI001B86CAE8|nr:uncharacterized protein EDB91DRAFT_1087704 [Suillus paluster]KAG1723786.1 hypothetical protein EDB91DRAFT_1087704 [Suillus paluster]